ncbi:neural cell adhesion molecule 1-like [Dermacentor silvarum]|uniref:neural cell adhesion molecule 1-like n=1 Tax=Dermacentor silvarum TaxID=543639 RepID=UPI002100DEB8|nr:neural cell adhesion molecule 1-like [Dermacentor silvarum]
MNAHRLPSRTTLLVLCVFLYICISCIECSTPPRIKPFSFPKVASKGEKISIICLVSEGTPPFSFSWSKEGKELQTSENVKVKAEPEYSVAFINSVDERSAGNYTCVVKNIFGFDSYSAYLDVEAPPVLKKTMSDTNVVQGGSVTLTCHAAGSPKPNVNWSRPSGMTPHHP